MKPYTLTAIILLFPLLTSVCFAEAEPSPDFINEIIEDPIAIERSLDIEIEHKNTNYLIPSPSKESLADFNNLSPEIQQRFLEKRLKFLLIMTKTINAFKYGLGAGSLVKDKLKFRKQIESLDPNEQAELENLTFRLRSNNAVLNLLKSFDKFLWSKQEFISHANEIGFVASANVIGLGEVNKFKGGGNFGLGISIGINIEKKSVVFQFFRNIEKYQSTILKAVGVVGAVGKAGIYMVADHQKLYKSNGYSFYPPVAPGFFSETPDKFITGMSTGLTLPPTPVADVLTYTNSFDDKTLFKMEFSAVNKYFVQVQAMDPTELVQIKATPLSLLMHNLRVNSFNAKACVHLFN